MESKKVKVGDTLILTALMLPFLGPLFMVFVFIFGSSKHHDFGGFLVAMSGFLITILFMIPLLKIIYLSQNLYIIIKKDRIVIKYNKVLKEINIDSNLKITHKSYKTKPIDKFILYFELYRIISGEDEIRFSTTYTPSIKKAKEKNFDEVDLEKLLIGDEKKLIFPKFLTLGIVPGHFKYFGFFLWGPRNQSKVVKYIKNVTSNNIDFIESSKNEDFKLILE